MRGTWRAIDLIRNSEGQSMPYCIRDSATAETPFTVLGAVAGLATGTAYWFGWPSCQ